MHTLLLIVDNTIKRTAIRHSLVSDLYFYLQHVIYARSCNERQCFASAGPLFYASAIQVKWWIAGTQC